MLLLDYVASGASAPCLRAMSERARKRHCVISSRCHFETIHIMPSPAPLSRRLFGLYCRRDDATIAAAAVAAAYFSSPRRRFRFISRRFLPLIFRRLFADCLIIFFISPS